MDLPCFSGKTLVICPHFDDACFSIGGLLVKRKSGETTVLTVFSKSQSSPNSLLLRSVSRASKVLKVNLLKEITTEYVSMIRKKEDWQFCDNVGAAQKILPFKDSALRGYTKPLLINEDRICKDPVYRAVFREIEKYVFSKVYDSISCPLAIGNHVDHLIVLKAFLQIIKQNRSIPKVVFYEDLPYASFYELDSINALAWKRIGISDPLFVDITNEMPLKHKLADLYRSQCNGDEKDRIAYHARRLFVSADRRVGAEGYCERLWRLDLG
jgi:LmbE family N-acetylglucosaminyl deacetylase